MKELASKAKAQNDEPKIKQSLGASQLAKIEKLLGEE